MAGSNRRNNGPKGSGEPGRNGARGFRVTIPSAHSAGTEVQKRIVDEATRIGFNSHSLFGLKLALEEAMINAIKHGNRFDASKKVHIEAKFAPDVVDITIEDEGPGFDRANVPDPLADENLEKCSGRGILLIESYMDEVSWSRDGRCLHMIKRNTEDTLPRQ